MKKVILAALLAISTNAMAHEHEAAHEATQEPVATTSEVKSQETVTRNALKVSCNSEEKIKVSSLVEKEGKTKTAEKELDKPEEGATFKSSVKSNDFRSNVVVSVDCN